MAISADNFDEKLIKKCKDCQFDDFIDPPFTFKQFKEQVMDVLTEEQFFNSRKAPEEEKEGASDQNSAKIVNFGSIESVNPVEKLTHRHMVEEDQIIPEGSDEDCSPMVKKKSK